MKVVKPLRLSVLHRPFHWQGQNHLGVSVLALADMGASPRLRPEPELWQLASETLTTSGGILDLAIPKACAEFLATGHAYTHHQDDKTACAVKIQLDTLEKTLVVFGDRHWVNDRPSAPLPYAEMPLDWRRAFGGPQFADNPHGIGANPETFPHGSIHPLPNIEPLRGRLSAPHQRAVPASFDALDITWPRRFNRIGKKYDADWLKNHFPGFADDIDWRLFNMAENDQQFPHLDALPPQAAYRIWNMHPEQPLQQGQLPPWRARCFINRQRRGEEVFEELALRHTTVWFFPHREQMVLVYQGSARINEDDAADVLQLLPALEKTGAARSANHYRKVLRQRLDKEKGALFTFREKDLLPEDCIGPWLDTEQVPAADPVAANATRYEHHLREEHRERLRTLGQDIDERFPLSASPQPPALDELAEFVEQMEQQAAQLKQQSDRRLRQRGLDPEQPVDLTGLPSGAESYQRQRDRLYQQQGNFSEKQRAVAEQALYQAYLMSAQAQGPAPRLKGDLAAIIRNRVQATLDGDKDLSGLDLTGADLGGMDLSHACLRGALMESANLRGARLDHADLTQAMLARADLTDASLRHAQLERASLALAKCGNTDFSHARLRETLLQETLLQHCNFSDAALSDLLGFKTYISQCIFQRARVHNVTLMELELDGLDFRHARLHKLSFIKCRLSAFDASHARLESCSWVETPADGSRFIAARLHNCSFAAQSSLKHSDFSDATLKQCNLRQMPLEQACFDRAHLDNSDLSEARLISASLQQLNGSGSLFVRVDFSGARLTQANLIGAIMQKCILSGADLRGANLFRCDLAQSRVDATTRLESSYTQRVKTLPRQRGETV
ncbi:Type III effector pipB2 [Serratia entomophila]|uniref:DUF2169 family type VI secretion system accessory protein n=1 Tax=Serratia entomophila TaxID=42906 RepID=UPI002179C53C|nr:DUF2169 domain-containing protein [Serratia entomophila]CAI0828798.1 Type III effector pipB2 [Serratia entomophila]CAI0887435.1 Type III effector pipB2 [Serratia entomophila]CAI2051313.1 Type III effector pipB2 [Serratia entomophila]